MTALPPALAGWARELAALPPPLVAALAPWLGRLSLAIGPMGSPRGAPTGELDGVDGLARRGSYERLLMTEWAIGLELPDEFLRRAGSGEHLFVAQARRQPSAARRSIAIVSAGPAQLGAPRLVHLAALIVMARRAAAAGAELAWGVLEAPDDGLLDGAAPEALERMLAARTSITATAEHAAAWHARLGASDGDRWLIGDGPALATARALGAGTLRVHDPLEAGVAAIDVEITARGASTPRARIRLPLPAADEGARLIRDPFRRATATPVTMPAAGDLTRLWFVPGSRRLAIEINRRIELWPIPGSPREAPGKPRLAPPVPPGSVLVALGARRRVPVAVMWSPDQPHAISMVDARLGPQTIHVALPLPVVKSLEGGLVSTRSAPRACAYLDLHPGGGSRDVLVIDGPCGAMLVLEEPIPGVSSTYARLLGLDEDFDETEVLGTAIYGDTAVFAALRAGGEVQLRQISRRGVHVVATAARRGFAGSEADAGLRFGFAHPTVRTWGPVAVRLDDRRWDVIRPGVTTTIRCNTEVVGVYEDDAPRLVAYVPGGRRLRLVDEHGTRDLPHAGGDIVAAAASSAAPVVAWATATEIVVYSLHHAAIVLRIPRVGA